MNVPARYPVMIIVLTLIVGCGQSSYTLRAGGDAAIMMTKDGKEWTGEILCMQDSSVYFLNAEGRSKVFRVQVGAIQEIRIEGYVNRGWVTPLILFQVLPTVLMTVAASTVDISPAAPLAIFGLPTLLTFALFEASTPDPPQSTEPFGPESIGPLQKYARFPQGLTAEQFKRLLTFYGQSEPDDIK